MTRYIMDTDEFVRRSRELHGDKYGYDEAVYVGQRTKVKIFCLACQKSFEQFPRKHYAQGEGCWDCGVAKRAKTQTLTFEQFVSCAKKKHGSRYEYDRTTYVKAKDKLTIRCRGCGDVFEQQGNAHLQGSGCPRCSSLQAHAKQSYGGAGFIVRARLIHGDKFEYLGCADVNWTQKSTVTWRCRDCGLIRDQLVLNHLAGNGCARCSKQERHTTDSFIAKSLATHGKDRYDYSEVTFVTNRIPVWITCKKCNTRWKIKPDNHMNGKGCPRCAAKKFISKGETEWLDSLSIDPKDRNTWVMIGERKFNVDALVGNTVYEFDGDYFHGNPAKFTPDRVNHLCGMTMKELLTRTLERRKLIEYAGYVVISMWESDWKRQCAKRTAV
jgi:phage FluMu protein Com